MKKYLFLPLLLFFSFCIPAFANIQDELKQLETSANGKLGISAINTVNNDHIQYRADERFPIQSTFKTMLVAAVLKKNILSEKIKYQKQDLIFWSPITEKNVSREMTVDALASAAMMYSDNTATNLLIKKLGGIQTVNAYARSIGDDTFSVENMEPDLNSDPNNKQDTSTPDAMLKSLQKIALGDALNKTHRAKLVKWMRDSKTGDTRIRAGVPKGWVVADKTGAGTTYGVTNDIGIIWPPKCNAPIVVSMYFVQDNKDAKRKDEVIAAATKLLLNAFAQNDSCIKLKSI